MKKIELKKWKDDGERIEVHSRELKSSNNANKIQWSQIAIVLVVVAGYFQVLRLQCIEQHKNIEQTIKHFQFTNRRVLWPFSVAAVADSYTIFPHVVDYVQEYEIESSCLYWEKFQTFFVCHKKCKFQVVQPWNWRHGPSLEFLHSVNFEGGLLVSVRRKIKITHKFLQI